MTYGKPREPQGHKGKTWATRGRQVSPALYFVIPKRTRISWLATLDAAACAAFI
jgi:hypothetical protein